MVGEPVSLAVDGLISRRAMSGANQEIHNPASYR